MEPPIVELVLFDVVGTIINDQWMGKSIVAECFYKAFLNNGYELNQERIRRERGKLKTTAIQNILNDVGASHEVASVIYHNFEQLLKDRLQDFTAMPGASELFALLRKANIKIGIGSGLSMELMLTLLQQAGWTSSDFDYIGSSEALGKGRPDPIMIFDAMHKLQVQDPQKVLKIGDTLTDIKEGQNAAVWTAGVLSGTTPREDFETLNPDYIFASLSELSNRFRL